MASKQKKIKKSRKDERRTFLNSFSIDNLIPPKFQVAAFFVVILLIFLIFYSPVYFGGKTFQSGDIVTSKSAITYLENHDEGFTLWNPYIFCGMPAYAIAVGYKWFNIVYVAMSTARDIFSSPFAVDYAKWTFYLLLLAFTMFLFMQRKTGNKLISLMVSLSTSFSMGIVVFLYIGHVTKLTAIWTFPLILLLLFNFQKKITFTEVMLLIVIFAMMFLGWHVQIIFYIFFAILIYFIYYLLRSIKLKDKVLSKQLVKSVLVFVIAVLVALVIQSDNLTQIWEYNPYSTRGSESILEKESTPTEQSESDFYQYATNWSFSPGEVLTYIIPSFYGFGKSTYSGPLSQNRPVEVNTYFGQMPFVDVAQYMGVIIFFLAIFSVVVNWKDPFVRFLTILSLIALLISFGRTFPLLYDLMFNYFPFFDKFRVPSMILVLVQLSFPVLAGLAIARIINLKKEPDKRVEKIIKNSTIVFAGLLLVTLFFGTPIREWFVDRVYNSAKWTSALRPRYGDGIINVLSDMFIYDARFAFFFCAASFGLIYIYVRSKVSADLMIIGITALVLFDIIRIDLRGETYVDNSAIEQQFEKPEYIKAIESANDNSVYRILNLKQDGSAGSVSQNSNFNAYFLQQDLYGYSGIKPRGFQDYMDVLKSPANLTLWRMANVKYIVFDSEQFIPGLELIYSGDKTFVYRNRNALPRAYFVNNVESKTAIETLNAVKDDSFDPKEIAYLENNNLVADKPDSTAQVIIDEYKDEKISITATASGNNFLFLGDTFLPTGWEAYVDGVETEIYKTNHNFRGILIPKGTHKIEFVYLPESFVITKYASLAVSSLVIIALVIGLVFRRKQNSIKAEQQFNA